MKKLPLSERIIMLEYIKKNYNEFHKVWTPKVIERLEVSIKNDINDLA